MKRWLLEQLEPVRNGRQVAVVLDSEAIVTEAQLAPFGDVVLATDWYTLRHAFEEQGRHRSSADRRLVILMRAADYREPSDVAYDIEQRSTVVPIRPPVPAEYHRLLLELPDEESDAFVALWQARPPDLFAELLGRRWGVVLPTDRDAIREVDLVIRLRSDASVPPALWSLLFNRLASPLARSLAQHPIDSQPLQAAWDSYLREGPASASASLFEALGPRIAPLFHVGILRPAAQEQALPGWVAVGSRDVEPVKRLRELLASLPEPWPPVGVGDWIRTAEWWGEVRLAMAEAGEQGATEREPAWSRWHELDVEFGPWLRRELGRLMTSSAPLPATLDRIGPVMAARIRSKEAARILLVVLDGMGFAQWSLLRRDARLRVVEGGATFAMVPTLTSVSRQAIFAGQLPRAFAQSLRTTAQEAERWTSFWAREGVPASEVRYLRTAGARAEDVPELGPATVIGLVVGAVDEVAHGAELLGDEQAFAALRVWLQRGFLRGLVEQATAASFEIWITADHGNVEAVALGIRQEGLAVEHAGTRVRWYADPRLRDGSRTQGIAWDPPGLPEGACYPLFAPGRGAYFSGAVRLSHGGLSLDEVIVPCVRVEP